ncbi:MAG: hypothetical protein WDN50_19700 [Bradyrhizobium sp.]
MGDLNSRRGQIQGQDMRGNANVINAMVRLMNMFGYVNNLRSMSQGRATFTMQFDHYAEAPANVSAEVQKKFAWRQLTTKRRESWPKQSLNVINRIATSERSVTSTTARRR